MEKVTAFQYFIFVFIAAVGVLQLVAAGTQLKGILFFKRKALAYFFSFLAIGGSFYWFFQWHNRIDTVMRHTGLEGAQLFRCFCMAAFAALVLTLIVSSLLKARRKGQPKGSRQGLDALKEMSYFEAVKHSLRSKED
jgi:hypothetical protein